MLQEQAAELRNADRIVEPLLAVVGQAEQVERRAVGMALIMALHRHDLGRLMLVRVEAVLVADEDLHRRDQRRHPHRHREHLARMRVRAVLQQVPGADRADDQAVVR